jgi:hypothetical protein
LEPDSADAADAGAVRISEFFGGRAEAVDSSEWLPIKDTNRASASKSIAFPFARARYGRLLLPICETKPF